MSAFLSVIDVMCAKIALLMLFIVIAKFATKRLNIKKVDRFLMKIHKPAGYALAVTGFIHGMFSLRIYTVTPIMVYVLGTVCLLSIAASIGSFICIKMLGKKWIIIHRITTMLAIITLILHPMLMK